MDDRRNYYRVLHLQPDALIGLVRVNYRTIMQKLSAHPDPGGENWSAAHINTAYQTLSDPRRREEYDRELLARYDIETIAEGLSKPKARRTMQPVDADVNRRNYYRILQCQHDSPIEILEASHAMLRAANADDGTLLDEALAPLSDRRLRAAYGRLLNVCEHFEAVERIQQDFTAKRSYKPVITSDCAFCKRPHAGHADDPEARCAECQGSVAHAHHSEGQTEAGMRFLAIRFPQIRGNFRSLKI